MRVEFSLLCDEPSCTHQVGAASQDEERAKLRVFETARVSGWDVDNAGHWCPDHRRA